MASIIKIFIALLATATVLSFATANDPFCSTADDKVLCSHLTHGAHTWPEAMTNTIKGAMDFAGTGKHVALTISSKMPPSLRAISKDSIVSTCKEGYQSIIDNLNDCLGYVKHDPTSALKFSLSAISFADCTDALDEFTLTVPEVTQFANEMRKYTSTLLAVASTKP